MCKFKRATTMALACAMLLSLLPMAVPKASAASTSTLANVTETYVDASDGSEVSKAETYSVTHKEKNPQKIADYTYQDYSESVERVYSHKDISYIYGYPDKTVRPDQPMTRSGAAAVFYRLYDGQHPAAKRSMSAGTFSDLSTDHWCYKGIEALYNAGFINGYGDGTFRPDDPVTRGEFAAWAFRWAQLDYTTDAKFSDVTSAHWAYGEINAAAAAGWVDGYPDGTFKPDQDISRVEVMKLVNRMVNRSITTDELEKLGAVNPYTDLVTTHWGYPQVMEATIPHSGAEWHGKFNQTPRRGQVGRRFCLPEQEVCRVYTERRRVVCQSW